MNNSKQNKDLALVLLAGVVIYALYSGKKRKGSLIIGDPYDGEFLPDVNNQVSTMPKIVDTASPVGDQLTDVLPVTVVEDSGGYKTVYDNAGNVYTPLNQPYAGGQYYYSNDGKVYDGSQGVDKLVFVGHLQAVYENSNSIAGVETNRKRRNLGAIKIV